MITKFEDAICWQKSKLLTITIYKHFSHNKDFGFRDQMQRATVSIMNNIAEGFERTSQKEFAHFLSIAKGSCGEVRSTLYVAKELQYLPEEEYDSLHDLSIEISKMLATLIKKLPN